MLEDGKGLGSGINPVSPDEDIKTDIETGSKINIQFGSDIVNLDDVPVVEGTPIETPKDTEPKEAEIKPTDDVEKKGEDKEEKDDILKSLVPGATIEIGETTYTVDNEGNLVDDKGAIFKKADELADFVKTLEHADEAGNSEMNLAGIMEAIGVEILNDDNTPVEFEDSPAGIKQYIDAVITTSQQEIAEATINSLYSRYPIVKDVLDYYLANGNSLDGFTERPDRSNLTIDENNQAQQEEIIRQAWKERGQEVDDGYIAYLKSSGTLLTIAEKELENLQKADAAERKRLADEAAEQQRAALEANQKYWEGVKSVIDSKKVAGYQIPDTIIVNRDGKKLAVTPNDFFNYLYQVDKDGYSRYQRDLMKDSAETRRDDEILRAFLKFTGGSYANLVDMAVKEKEVIKLRAKAKENNAHKTTYKVTPPAKEKTDIQFGI